MSRDNILIVMFWLTCLAGAAPAKAALSVSVSPDSLGIGPIAYSSVTLPATPIVITNDGDVAATYSLQVATGTTDTPWSIGTSTPSSTDVVVLFGVIHGSRTQTWEYDTTDAITAADQTCTTSKYSVDASSTGVNVSPTEERLLWLRLDMPPMGTTDYQQILTLTVTAQ